MAGGPRSCRPGRRASGYTPHSDCCRRRSEDARPPAFRSELLQQPVDIVELRLRPVAIGAAAAEFVLDRAGALALHLLRHPHRVALVGAGGALAELPAERVALVAAPVLPGQRALRRAVPVAPPVLQAHAGVAVRVAAIVALAGLAGAELLGHLLAHLAAALLQRLDRPLLGLPGGAVLPLAQRLPGVAHRLVGLAEALRHLAGEIAELLHELAKRPAQRLLHPPVGLARRLLAALGGLAATPGVGPAGARLAILVARLPGAVL